jgi:DNA/RNA endonuclease YhcR with UshA esterase domain
MIPTPGGKSYIMPVGKVAALYRKHSGKQSVRVAGGTGDLDVVASRTDDRFFLHVVNTNRTNSQACRLAIEGYALESGKAFEIATDPMAEITSFEDDPMKVREKAVPTDQPYQFPAASVTAFEFSARKA